MSINNSEIVQHIKIWTANIHQQTASNHLLTYTEVIGMKFGMGTLGDMNHLKNKPILSVAHLSQDQFGLALVHLENVVQGTIREAIQHKSIELPPPPVVPNTAIIKLHSFALPGGLTSKHFIT